MSFLYTPHLAHNSTRQCFGLGVPNDHGDTHTVRRFFAAHSPRERPRWISCCMRNNPSATPASVVSGTAPARVCIAAVGSIGGDSSCRVQAFRFA